MLRKQSFVLLVFLYKPSVLDHYPQGQGDIPLASTALALCLSDILPPYLLLNPLTPVPPVTAHDESWPLFHFWCHHLWLKLASLTAGGKSISSDTQISTAQHRTSLVNKGFIIWLSGKFFLRDTAGSPEWARGAIWPARVANHSAGFDSSCSLMGLAL